MIIEILACVVMENRSILKPFNKSQNRAKAVVASVRNDRSSVLKHLHVEAGLGAAQCADRVHGEFS